jgi:cytochrome c5
LGATSGPVHTDNIEDFMSNVTHTAEEEEGHETPIKTSGQLIAAIVAAFVIPIFAIVLLVKNVGMDAKAGAGAAAMSAEAVAERIQPVGAVHLKLEGGPLKSGEEVYKAQCVACHAAGLAGAPKFGDEAAWSARIKTGFEALVSSALKGKGAMGAQGGGDFSDIEISRGVAFMANGAGANFAEPKPAAASDAASK